MATLAGTVRMLYIVVGHSSDNEHRSDSSNHTTHKNEGFASTVVTRGMNCPRERKCIDKEGRC